MIQCKIKKWGNSIGILIPKEEAKILNLSEGQEVAIEITKKENPLKELFGFGKRTGVHLSKKHVVEARKMLESKWV